MLTFKILEIKGFGSIRDLFRINLDSVGLNMIRQDNGHGKTTIFSALYWALSGKSLKADSTIATYGYLRDSQWKGTYVSISYQNGGIDYHIVRCLDYAGKIENIKGGNKIFFYTNTILSNLSKQKEIQAGIQASIGVSPELFKTSILFGQKLKRFLDETGPDKKKLFEEAFEILYLKKAKDLADAEVKNLQKSLGELSPKISLYEIRVEEYTKTHDTVQAMVTNFDKDKEKRIAEKTLVAKRIKNQIGDLVEIPETDIEPLQKELALIVITPGELPNTRADISKQQKIVQGLEFSLESTARELDKLKAEYKSATNLCTHCGNKLTTKQIKARKETYLKRVKAYKAEILKLSNKFVDYTRELCELKTKEASLSSKHDTKTNLEKSISKLELQKSKRESYLNHLLYLKQQLADTFKEIAAMKVEDLVGHDKRAMYSKKIRKLQAKLKPLNLLKENILADISDYKWMANVPFSNTGIKAFLFESLLNQLNAHLQNYSEWVEHRVVFEIDMKSANKNIETYIYMGDYIKPIADLSGGQKQLVDIVTAFAMHDMVLEKIDCNILILDEVFESLSAKNIDIVSELITTKNKDKAIWLITHRQEFNPANSRNIDLRFQNGLTTLK